MDQIGKRNKLEVNGGIVYATEADHLRMEIAAVNQGYANAQIDDYRGLARADYLWKPGTVLELEARFSHDDGELRGTAGFGFWNAPFGPGTTVLPALPQASWFFYASPPGNLPLAPTDEVGRGWFAATIDAGTWQALTWAPLAPAVLLLNQLAAVRSTLWPRVRRGLQISFARLPPAMRDWQAYRLEWRDEGCSFFVNDDPVLHSPFRPRGPLGFVCWIDNQYLIATARGRVGWGTLSLDDVQWLEIANLRVDQMR